MNWWRLQVVQKFTGLSVLDSFLLSWCWWPFRHNCRRS